MNLKDLRSAPPHLTLAAMTELLGATSDALDLAKRGFKTRPLFLWNNETRTTCSDDMTIERFCYLLNEGSVRLELELTHPDGTVECLRVAGDSDASP